MQLQTKTVRQGINKAYLKVNIKRNDLDAFKNEATVYLNNLEQAKGKDEEHLKGYLSNFIRNAFYNKENRLVQTGGGEDKIDLCIYKDSSVKSVIEVIFETKLPSNSTQMISKDRPNAKALHQAIHYYFEEREAGNEDLKQVIITNYYEFFFFDAQDIERNFYSKKSLVKTFRDWQSNLKVSSNKPFMYGKFEEFIAGSEINLNCISLNLKDYKEHLEAPDSEESDKKLIAIYKLFSPQHLVKKPFANDSNSLNRGFYNELLYILGLVDVKEKKGGMLIKRLPEVERQRGSLIENTIEILLYDQHMGKLRDSGIQYGTSEEEKQFSVALELVITWMNRILFLKLMEAQLLSYHQHDEKFKFLDFKTIDEYDELEKLFFRVLALRNEERPGSVQDRFGHIPYLNSSLFDATKLEDLTTRISGLDDKAYLKLYPKSILKKSSNPPDGKLKTLDYLLQFLDAYNFSAESSGGVQTEDKALINASVLGLIFEKINGYKDGSFFTPGFITEYMARETLRKSVTEKLNEAFNWNCKEFSELHRKIDSKPLKEVNEVINTITVCDPAVGSGHFLVSCLNELIAIKSELKILCDQDGRRIPYLDILVENDELAIEHEGELFEYKLNHEWINGKVNRKPAGKERQKIQEALFHEKKLIIENCLFGVDINPNSVKICRLRLWIELLKNAYYSANESFTELEVLPNIDINIKQGNSLVSRFKLEDDLRTIFKKSQHSLEDYKYAVRAYRKTRDRGEKQRLQKLIDDIKSEYSESLLNNKPINRKLSQARGKLELMRNKDLFGGGKATIKDLTNQEKKVKKLEKQKAEEENGVFFRDAFEWRFEFPEVLSEEGDFIGFDVVIGNPPYGTSIEKKLRKFLVDNISKVPDYEIYYWFIELSKLITKKYGTSSLIIPNTLLFNVFAESYRMKLVKEVDVLEILDCTDFQIFQDATVKNIILTFQNAKRQNYIVYRNTKNVSTFFKLIEKPRLKSQLESIENGSKNWGLLFKLDEQVIDLVNKINSNNDLINYFDVSQGYIPYRKRDLIKIYGEKKGDSILKNREWHSDKKLTSEYKQEIFGKDISKYGYNATNSFVKYGRHLATYVDPVFFESKRILIREITNPTIIAVLLEREFVNDPQLINIIPKKKDNDFLELEYLWAILNSKLATFYHFNSSPKATKGSFPKILVSDLKEFPLPNTLNYRDRVVKIVQKIIHKKNLSSSSDTSKLEKELNQIVYKLYGLTKDEIEIVENNI